MQIDWQSGESQLILNPRLPAEEANEFLNIYRQMPNLPGHLWLATSGTTAHQQNPRKLVALSKDAFLNSAEAVNQLLGAQKTDVWAHALPNFHVGGLGIWARAFLSKSSVVQVISNRGWDPDGFCQGVKRAAATLSALVPAQVYDLVERKEICPPHLRAVIVGGGQLHPQLFWQAIGLGWPLLPSYGMTECASQVATTSINSIRRYLQKEKSEREDEAKLPELKVLGHLQVKSDEQGWLCIRGSSLLSGYGLRRHEDILFFDPKQEGGWFVSQDKGQVNGDSVQVWGRGSDFVKVLGENVNLSELENSASEIARSLGYVGDLAIGAIPDARAGFQLWLFIAQTPEGLGDKVKTEFNLKVAPYAKLCGLRPLPSGVRNSMGKLMRHRLQL